ncbi:MAG: Crp/Fnr family transcriptional regulator [Chitinophagaceae bacterium]|nr:Crp/Fnr family transcriptional regulator [Oligoflexus sp.]
MKEKYSDLVKKLSPFYSISGEDWEELASHLTRKELRAGEYFDKTGSVSTEFAYVERGLFRSFYRNANGDEFIKNFAHEGQLLGSFTSLITGRPSELSLQSLEPSVILVLDARTFCDLCDRSAIWLRAYRMIAEEAFMQSEKKEQQLLLYNAAQRYEIFLKSYSSISKRIHQYMIAMYLGISPVSLSRIINNNLKTGKT